MVKFPDYSPVHAGKLDDLASRLFHREVRIEKTSELLEKIREQAEHFNSSNHTNPLMKSMETSMETAKLGVLGEIAAADLLGVDHEVKIGVDLSDKHSYAKDITTPDGLRIEVKTFASKYSRYCRLTYPETGLKTLRAHRDLVDYVVFASPVAEDDASWTVAAVWVLETERFLDGIAPPIGDEYERFSPYSNTAKFCRGDVFRVNDKYVEFD